MSPSRLKIGLSTRTGAMLAFTMSKALFLSERASTFVFRSILENSGPIERVFKTYNPLEVNLPSIKKNREKPGISR